MEPIKSVKQRITNIQENLKTADTETFEKLNELGAAGQHDIHKDEVMADLCPGWGQWSQWAQNR